MPSRKQYIRAAKRQYHAEGEVEIDDKPIISAPDRKIGAYVQAWVWVYAIDAKKEKR